MDLKVKMSDLPIAVVVTPPNQIFIDTAGTTKSVTLSVLFNNVTLTGTPTAPTAAPATNTTQIATTAFVIANATGGDMFLADNLAGIASPSAARANLGLNNVPNIDTTNAANITTGILPLAVLPPEVFERLYVYTGVQLTPELMGLTTGNVQNGDFVSIQNIANANDKRTWGVINDAALASAGSFLEIAAGIAPDSTLFAGQAGSYYLARANHTGVQAQSTITNLVSDLVLKAPLASPALTGVPTAPTATIGTNTTQLATTEFVIANAVIGGSGDALISNPLSQFAPTTSLQLLGVISDETGAGKLVFATSPALLGTPTAPTAAPATNTTQLATCAFVLANIGGGAPVADGDYIDITVSNSGLTWTIDPNAVNNAKLATMSSKVYKGRTTAGIGNVEDVPVAVLKADLVLVKADVGLSNVTNTSDAVKFSSTPLTGIPTTPLASVDTNTTQIASTSFVIGQAASANPLAGGSAAPGVSTRYARADHVHPAAGGGTWGSITGTLSAQTDLNNALNLKAPLASPVLTGTPLSTTAAIDTNTAQVATTAFVVAQASSTLPLAVGSATIGTSLRYAREDHIHSDSGGGAWGTITGTLSAQTDLNNALNLKAPLASPALTGAPIAPTASTDTNTTQLATTAFVIGQASSSFPPAPTASSSIGSSLKYARSDHAHGPQTSVTGNSGTTTAASGLATLTTTVFLAASAAPTVGQVLTALNGSTADWQTPAGGGGVGADVIFDVKGDLAVGTGADTAIRLAAGTNGQILSADSVEATGLKWITPAGSGDPVGDYLNTFIQTWDSNASATATQWRNVCWSAKLDLLAAVSDNGTTSSIMTSPDGVTWTARTTPNQVWYSIAWSPELGLFCAVGSSGAGNRVITSADGIAWANQTSAADVSWSSVCWAAGIGLFVAVASTGVANGIMTSPDGVTWTTRAPAVNSKAWRSVCWSPQLKLLVASNSNAATGDQIMTSSDGITWSTQTGAVAAQCWSVVWAPALKLFVGVYRTNAQGAQTSPDGITWTPRTTPNDDWIGISWSPALKVLIALNNNKTTSGTSPNIMYSRNGINWTSLVVTSTTPRWHFGACWAGQLGRFVIISYKTTDPQVLASLEFDNFK